MPHLSTAPRRSVDDGDLVRRAQDGDVGAFDALIRRYRPLILSACRTVAVPPAELDDAMQEASRAIWSGLRGFRHRSSLGTWIYTIARREAVDVAARSGRLPIPVQYVPDIPSSYSVESQVADRLTVRQALAGVPGPFREAVRLRDMEGWSYADIAATLGIRVDTVKSRIARGRAHVRSQLDDGSAQRSVSRPGRGCVADRAGSVVPW